MTYAKVINNEIVEYNKSLPVATESTIFGINATDAELAVAGFYPIVGTEPTYDNATHKNNGVSYTFDGTQVNKVYDIVVIPLDDLKANKIQALKEKTNLSAPVTIGLVTYNGGESSASAIMGGVNLANLNQETNISIWDINDTVRVYSITDAMSIVNTIALAYRDSVLTRQNKITAINNIIVDANGTYPTYESAKAALDLITI